MVTLKTVMRTAAVLLGGVALSVLVSGTLELLLNSSSAIVRLNKTSPNSPEWPEMMNQLRRSGLVSFYLIDPLTGLLVGCFVGLVQKYWAPIVAASCCIPKLLFVFFGDEHRVWMRSVRGILIYTFDNSLPFLAAIIAASICHRLISRRELGTSNTVTDQI